MKSALVALGFALIFFLSCTDYSDLEKFPSKEKMPQGHSSSSSEEFLSSNSEIAVSSSSAESSSSVEESSSSYSIADNSSSSFEMEVSSSSFSSSSVHSSSSNSSSSSVAISSSSFSSSSVHSSSSSSNSSSSVVVSSSSFSSSSVQNSSSSALKECEGTFNPASKFCYDGVVYDKCDGMEYIPSSQICQNGVATPARCGGVGYNPITQGCCGSAIYSRATQRCTGGVVETMCGSGWYNAVTHFCTRSENNPQVVLLCGGKGYDTRAKFCSGGTIYDKCGDSDYNPSTHFCSGTTAYSKCGGTVEYTPATENCCGSNKYIIASQFCNDNTIHNKCGGTIEYNPATENCCGSNKYNISTQKCENNVIETKCGTNDWYNSLTQFCHANNTIYNKCDNSEYDPLTKYCSNGTLKNYGFVTYSGQTYKTVEIGTQVWMAENLNYDASGSVCYANREANCTTYGKLYNWATAMALPDSCNRRTCASQVDAKHNGICPVGWHIPSDAEWTTLTNFVFVVLTDTWMMVTKLKATSGWNKNGNGTDDYGFAALPGGYSNSGRSFTEVGSTGFWWSSTEDGANDAYSRIMGYDYEVIGGGNNGFSKSYFSFSVRCLQD